MDVINRDWYINWFGNDYLTVYAHRDEQEARDLINLIQSNIKVSPWAKILDLCCGQGRHALILARMGYTVFGMDLSRTLLNAAQFKKDKHQNVYFIQADMRYLPTVDTIHLLLNLFTSFGYFDRDDENLSVFHEFYKVLQKGGNFVFDYLNKTHVLQNLVPFENDQIAGIQIDIEREIEGSRVQKKIVLKKNTKESIFYESVKMYQPDEIFMMLKQAGLSVLRVFGDYSGSDFNQDSPRMVVIGEKL
jgi:ubiquinone/menaquinone biosynthesis C-methylase UbiE